MSSSHFIRSCSALVLLFSGALAACAGEVIPIGEHAQAHSTNGGVDGGGDGGGLATCEAPTGPVHKYTSIADTEARTAGTWRLCSGGIHSPTDTAGIELAAGKARFLVKSGDSLVQGGGAAYERKVSIIDTTSMNGPGAYQMNFELLGGSGNSYTTRTSEDGRFLELNEGTSAKQARYIRVAAPPPPCRIQGVPHVYTSITDVSARISGKWSICSGGIGSPADTRGLELESARAYFLVEASGKLVRGPGWDYERDVEIIDATSMNGAGSYQINLDGGAGGNGYFSRVSASGDVLELDEGTSGKKVVYRRVP